MNILIFVMTLLMMLGLLTYARLDSFRSTQTFRHLFSDYMENIERSDFNKGADKAYESISVKEKKETPSEGTKEEGTRKISIVTLLDKTKREAQAAQWKQTQVLLRNLIDQLYKDQPFYQKAMEERGSLPDSLIAAIVAAIDAAPRETRIKNAAGLGNLKLEDPVFNVLLYKIVKGLPKQDFGMAERSKPQPTYEEQTNVDSGSSDASQGGSASDYKSPEGYYSLLDFVTDDPSPKIRVFLAPPEVLQAIYREPHIVKEIIMERMKLYRLAVGGGDKKELTEKFKRQFESFKDPALDNAFLNYAVTKTKPD